MTIIHDFYELAEEYGQCSSDVLFNLRDENKHIVINIINPAVAEEFEEYIDEGLVTISGTIFTFNITDEQNPEGTALEDDTLLIRLRDLLYVYY